MSVLQHVHDLPDEDELAQLLGAATPHFAFQIGERLAQLAATLPPGHPRAAELAAQIARLDRLGRDGETGRVSDPDLAPLASLSGLRHPG